MRSTHREMRCSAAVQAPRYRAARRAAMRFAHCVIRPAENITLHTSAMMAARPPAVRAATATFANSKILAARPGRVTGCC